MAVAAIEKTDHFFESLGVPTRLSAYPFDAEELAESVSARFEKNSPNASPEPQNLDRRQIKALLRSKQ